MNPHLEIRITPIKPVKIMKPISRIVCILGCLLFSCEDAEIETFTLHIGKIHKIELLDEKDVTFGSMDSVKIAKFVSFLLTAGKDNAGRDFTSNDFIKLYGSNGEVFQIEIYKFMFKVKGTTFVVNANIIKKMRDIFGNNSLIETPDLNTR